MRAYRRYFKETFEEIEVVDIQLFGESPAQNEYLNALVDQIQDLDLILRFDEGDIENEETC